MRIVLWPGNIISESDGQTHYVSGVRLAQLYGVEYRKCAVVIKGDRSFRSLPGDVNLYPRTDGQYAPIQTADSAALSRSAG